MVIVTLCGNRIETKRTKRLLLLTLKEWKMNRFTRERPTRTDTLKRSAASKSNSNVQEEIRNSKPPSVANNESVLLDR